MAFSLARDAGFEGVELVVGPEVALRGAGYVRRLVQDYLPVLSVHPPILPYPSRNRPAAMLPYLVSLAERVNCGLVVLHTPKVVHTEDPGWSDFVSALHGCRQKANPGVQISLENSGFFRPCDSRYILHDLRKLRAFADHLGLPLTFDTAHAGTSPYELSEAYTLVQDRVVNIHFSDLVHRRIFPDWPPLYTLFRHHQKPGDGVLPLADFMRVALGSGYSGTFTVEVSPTALRAWRPSQVRKALTALVGNIRQMEAEATILP